MVNLFEIARQAQGGSGIDHLSRQFGLDAGQTQRALEALLPAFTVAFQKHVLNPQAFAELMGVIASGRYAPFFDGARKPERVGDGAAAILFGSPEIARQVAAQAASISGLGAQILADMLPTLAAILMGGLSRYASAEGFADFLRQWADAIKAARPPASPPPKPADPWSAWADAMGAMLGGSGARPAPAPPLDAWFKLMSSVGAPAPKPPPSLPNPFEAVAQMFESGREVQAQHLASFNRIMDSVWAKPSAR